MIRQSSNAIAEIEIANEHPGLRQPRKRRKFISSESPRRPMLCATCELDVKDEEIEVFCTRCRFRIHNRNLCKYPELQVSTASGTYCSMECERNQEVYEMRIIAEKSFRCQGTLVPNQRNFASTAQTKTMVSNTRCGLC
jgi:hypothetical protein